MRALPIALAFALAAISARAVAQTSPQAEALFRDGRKAAIAGDFATAAARFAESERIEPAPGTLLNLADSEEHLGRLVSAREHFNLAASGFPLGDKRRALSTQRAGDLDKRVGHLTLHVAPSVPEGATIRRGATILDRTSLATAIDVDPGEQTLVVSAHGHVDRTFSIHVADGQAVETTIDVGDVTPSAAPAAPPERAPPPVDRPPVPAKSNGLRTVGFVVGGVGLVTVAVGAVTGILAVGKSGAVKDHCDASYACDQTGVDAASAGKVLSPVSTVTLIAGAVLVGAGAYFVLSGGTSKKTAVVPFATPFGGGASLFHSF